MAKTITLNYKENEYTLEFTRRTVRAMEENGFVISDISQKPVSGIPTLFAGAFLAHHRLVKPSVIEEIYEALTKKEDFLEKLAEMYREPIESLFDEPEESEGNATWGASW